MSLMTSNCEIVDNVACGQSFQYCRTHKVEPKDCPGNAKPKGPESQAAALYQYQVAINSVAAAAAKREFKVGDKVRHVPASPYADCYSRYGFAGGAEATVVDPRSTSSIEVQTVTGQVAFLESEWLEHA